MKLYLEFEGRPVDPHGMSPVSDPPLWSDEDRAPDLPSGILMGIVERVTFHSEESHYTVLKLAVERGCVDEQGLPIDVGTVVSAVGHWGDPTDGVRVRVTGSWGKHSAHGLQFQFELVEFLPPLGRAGIIKYLASKAFRGVGPKLAARIVETLGTDTLEIIRNEPERLATVKGLKRQVREDLVAAVRAQLVAHRVKAFLLDCGLGPGQSELALKKLGSESEQRIRENPYILATGIPGLGFAIADRVARKLGFDSSSSERLCAGLRFALERASNDGHSLLEKNALFERTIELLGEETSAEDLALALQEQLRIGELKVEADLREDAELIYLPRYQTCESRLADNLTGLMKRKEVRALATEAELLLAEKSAKIELHPTQRAAVLGLMSSAVGLLTGGPGVGKTTIVRLLVELAEGAGAKVLLASPTGRAAKRLSEATDRPASTIHRMLGYDQEKHGFRHDEENPLTADLVIIDELSMLDLILAHQLVKAIEPPTRVIFIGDPNQLPAVGAGAVLSDLIESERIPVWRLTEIYRQRADSKIVTNAYRILCGAEPEFPEAGNATSDFYFFPAQDDYSTADRTVEVVTERIPRTFGLDWVNDVQVLAPMYRGGCGVDVLNAKLREALGSGGAEAKRGDRIWRTGDRVIHTRNDYEREIFNGDMGRISRINLDSSGLFVQFPGREVFYEPAEFGDLQPAFAITVHRSQGGEFPAVVFPLVTSHYLMLQRHLLYTAVTRAKQLVVLVGSRRALQMALDNADQRHRESALADRLRKLLEES